MSNGWKLFYDAIFEFKKQYYGPLLRHEHLAQKSQKHFPKFKIPGVEDAIAMDFWGYWFIKDGQNYLVSSTDGEGVEIDINKLLPLEARDIQKVSDTRGEVYYLVRNPVSKTFEENQTYTPKEFIDNLTLLAHSMPKHQKLMAMMAMSQLWDRSYYRMCTPPGFGKDSIVDICSSFFGECGTVESPTAAKLEDRATVLKWLVINEVVGIQKADWDIIQQFLLSAGAHKNEITKRSRAFQNVGEIIDTSKFSLSLFYNDISNYPKVKEYFDFVTKAAVKDRFPAFRFYGRYTEDFNAMRSINLQNFVSENWDFYIGMIESFLYYRSNYYKHLHNYSTQKLMRVKGREQINLGRLLKVVDIYCESQEEFDSWIEVINDSRMDYTTMGEYAKLEMQYEKKFGEHSIQDLRTEITKYNTFGEKNNRVRELLKGNDKPAQSTVQADVAVWDFNDKEIL